MVVAEIGWKLSAANDEVYGSLPTRAGKPRGQAAAALLTLQSLQDEVLAETLSALGGGATNLEQLWQGIETHLDASLRRPAVQVLSALLPGAPASSAAHPRGLAGLLQLEMYRLGLTLPSANALLLRTLILETERAEHQARRSLPDHRDLLKRYLWSLRA